MQTYLNACFFFCQTEQEEGDNSKVAVPALLRGGGDPPHPVSPTDSLLQHWDSTVTTLVQSSITPQCSTSGGDLYILTGAGGLRAAEDGDEECQTKPLWSAVCCAAPEGKSSFSVGLIKEAGEGERQVSVKELEEMLGVTELFSDGCGGADGEAVGITVGLHSEGLPDNAQKLDADLTAENTGGNEVDSNTAGRVTEGGEVDSDTNSQDPNEDIKDGREALIAGEQVADAQPEEADVADATRESGGEGQRDVTHSGAVRSKSPRSSAEHETVAEQEADTNSSSTLVFVLSTTMSILKAPLRPVFSTIMQLPGQVIQVTEPCRHSYILHLQVHSGNKILHLYKKKKTMGQNHRQYNK